MGILNKKNTKKKQDAVEKKTPEAIRYLRKSYVSLAQEPHKEAIAPCEVEIEKLKQKLDDVIELNKKNPDTPAVIERIRELRSEIEDKEKELSKISLKNQMDHTLMSLAVSLDRAYVHARVLPMYKELAEHLHKSRKLIGAIISSYGNTSLSLPGISSLCESVGVYAVDNVNMDISSIESIDIKELEKKFHARRKELQKKKEHEESILGAL